MSLSVKFRESFIFGIFEVSDSDQKICYKYDKEYLLPHRNEDYQQKICSRIFSIKSCNFTHKYLVSVSIAHTK